MNRPSWETTIEAFDKVVIGRFTLAGIFAFHIYWYWVIRPVAVAVTNFYEGGWRSMSDELWYECRVLLGRALYAAPTLIPVAVAFEYPNGSAGRKVILAVPWLRHIPSEFHDMISAIITLVLGAYLDDRTIFIVSTILIIAFVLFSAWAYEIGRSEIDFIVNIPVWKVMKAMPTGCFRYIWGVIRLPVIFWHRQWLLPKAPNTAIQDEENARGSVEEKSSSSLFKQHAENPAALADQDKYLQEKILEDTGA